MRGAHELDQRFGLRDHLASLKDESGKLRCTVTARNRETDAAGNDVLLSALDTTDFDELWLFAVDAGDGLSVADCQGITRFRQRGGGIFATRDHQDLGSSLCTLGGVGRAHFFHSKHPDPDESRHVRDDQDTKAISWPNYHSGSNGDYQRITAVEPVHELLVNLNNASGVIEYFPAHPHEGGVGVPNGEEPARVIATGVSQATHRPFNLMVAFESTRDQHGNSLGRAVADHLQRDLPIATISTQSKDKPTRAGKLLVKLSRRTSDTRSQPSSRQPSPGRRRRRSASRATRSLRLPCSPSPLRRPPCRG